ncbi:unnamed protein product [Clavelina lepadiformis]|uniref:Bestrophin homolog n=1 Tax=Clavelina lepadiformis TaxID=159417 RepID=A0ABP0F131_CLALP
MTVTYTHKVADARLGGFSSLLIRWKGSVYKLFYKEFVIFITLYCVVSMTYRFGMSRNGKEYFEKLCLQFEHYTDLIPISFVLGFYVSIVVGRWWSQFENLPFPDRLMLIITSSVHGADERGRLIRRTLLRYLNQAQVLTYRCMSTAVYKRFPTMRHVIDAGLMTENEYQEYENFKTENLKYWVPLLWFSNLASKLRQEGRIYDDMTYKLIMQELIVFRSACGTLVGYDWISVPLVYTQVVTVAVYMYFVSTLLSRQYLDPSSGIDGHKVDLYVPIFTICQFFFYMGWLKVAEQLINPFGEDDDDFEVNWCIDRNHEIAMIVADKMYAKHPKLEKDKHWNVTNPDLPYTAASVNHKVSPFMGSTFDMRVDKDEMKIIENLFSNEPKTHPVSDKSADILSNGKQTPNLVQTSNQKKAPKSLKTFMAPSLNLPGYQYNNETNKLIVSSNDHDHDHVTTEVSGDEDDMSLADLSDQSQHDGDISVTSDSDDDTLISNQPNKDVTDDDLLSTNKSYSEMQETKLKIEKKQKKADVKQDIFFSSIPSGTFALSSNSFLQNSKSHKLSGKETSYDKNEERRNAEKRGVLLSNRRRRTRGALPPRKRARRTAGDGGVWLKWQKKRLQNGSAVGSPDTGSMFSETDVGSGAFFDSPFGSFLSCSASIPSPKPLRFAFRTRRNTYGDNTSLTSSLPSPSGTEGIATDTMSTPGFASDYFNRLNSNVDSSRAENSTCNSPTHNQPPLPFNPYISSSVKEDFIRPYTEDIRKRLQIVPASSPVPKSPRGTFWNRKSSSGSDNHKINLLLSAETQPKTSSVSGAKSSSEVTFQGTKAHNRFFKSKDVSTGKQSRDSTSSNSKRNGNGLSKPTGEEAAQFNARTQNKPASNTITIQQSSDHLLKDCNNNLNMNQEPWLSVSLNTPRKPSNRWWNAFKMWTAKRKGTKFKSMEPLMPNCQLNLLPTIESEGNFSKTDFKEFAFDDLKTDEMRNSLTSDGSQICIEVSQHKKPPYSDEGFSLKHLEEERILSQTEEGFGDRSQDASVVKDHSKTQSVQWVNEGVEQNFSFQLVERPSTLLVKCVTDENINLAAPEPTVTENHKEHHQRLTAITNSTEPEDPLDHSSKISPDQASNISPQLLLRCSNSFPTGLLTDTEDGNDANKEEDINGTFESARTLKHSNELLSRSCSIQANVSESKSISGEESWKSCSKTIPSSIEISKHDEEELIHHASSSDLDDVCTESIVIPHAPSIQQNIVSPEKDNEVGIEIIPEAKSNRGDVNVEMKPFPSHDRMGESKDRETQKLNFTNKGLTSTLEAIPEIL